MVSRAGPVLLAGHDPYERIRNPGPLQRHQVSRIEQELRDLAFVDLLGDDIVRELRLDELGHHDVRAVGVLLLGAAECRRGRYPKEPQRRC